MEGNLRRVFMNMAHLHLMLTHVPVIGIPLLLMVLLAGRLENHSFTIRLALVGLVSVCMAGILAYFSGEGAEEIVESIPGISRIALDAHEEVGEITFALTGCLAGMALASLMLFQRDWVLKFGIPATLIFGALLTALLGYTAYLGGGIRHTENGVMNTAEKTIPSFHHKEDEDD